MPADLVLTDLVDRDDVGMVEGRRRLRLALEAADALLVPHQLGRQNLERDAPLERLILRQVDLAHAAGP